MSFADKYDLLISLIEDAVKANNEEIIEKLSKALGTNTRHLTEAFQFISGITLSQYIKQRRLVNALKYRFTEGCSLEDASIKFGFPDAATMSKAFKSHFGISPSQMSSDELNACEPLTLNFLSTADPAISENAPISYNHDGLTDELLQLAEVYDLSRSEAFFAYDLSQKRGLPIERAFELVSNFTCQETFPMDNKEFLGLLDQLGKYINKEKCFVINTHRIAEVRRAMEILVELFPDYNKGLKDDPLQMGAMILYVDAPDIVVRGEKELSLFAEFCAIVDNFEMSAMDRESAHLGAVIQRVYKRIS